MKLNSKPFSKEKQDKLKAAVLHELGLHPTKPYNYKQLGKHIKLHDEYFAELFFYDSINEDSFRDELQKMMNQLVIEKKLIEIAKGKYRIIPESKYVEGNIAFNSSGAAYVMNEDYEKDIYIDPRNTGKALHGDTVKILMYAHREGKRSEGEVVEVVKRARTDYSGVLSIKENIPFLIPDNNKMPVDIFIPPKYLGDARNGEKVVVRITEWLDNARNPAGQVIKVLGKPGENNAEMDAILVEYGFPLQFPDEVEMEAAKIPFEISKEEISKRRDFREVTTFTIDPADAKDFDDALSFQKLKNGNYEVGVHIADVSHYMKENTALEKEALSRATSVYLVDRVIPMLPEKLSNHVCSLRPFEEKLCFAAVFEINDEAEVLNEWFGRTVIYSRRRFSYEEAQEVIETGEGDLKFEITTLDRLAKKLRKQRFAKGAVNFDKIEVKFNLDDKGFPTGVYLKENKDSNKLIEEFMLLANKNVAEFVGKFHAKYPAGRPKTEDGGSPKDSHNKKLTYVYRIHDSPDMEKVKQFALFALRFGYKINMANEKALAHSINKLVVDVKGKGEQNLLESLAIRSMAKAKYSTENIGHYGLAFEYYSHFTSPIRRYPDVMAHRLLAHYLDGGKTVESKNYEQWCKHSSDKESQAAEAERASVKYKQVQYLQDHVGEVFEAIISGVTDWGMYVELTDSKCEGMIRLRDLSDDYYELDERNLCLIGTRSKRKFSLGDKLQVILKSADPVRKQIDFLLNEEKRRVAKPSPIFFPKKKSHKR